MDKTIPVRGFKKYWKWLFGAFILFCIYNFVVGFNSGTDLPECGDRNVTEKQIPELFSQHAARNGYTIDSSQVIISKPKESVYDRTAGVRSCTATITVRNGESVRSDSIGYQLAWVDKNQTRYRLDIEY